MSSGGARLCHDTNGVDVIHVVGDSHVSMFTGLHGVCPLLGQYAPQALVGFRVLHVGPFLAHSVATPGHRVRALLRSCAERVPRGARVIVSFGEIDCRNHLVRHALGPSFEATRSRRADRCIEARACDLGYRYARSVTRQFPKRQLMLAVPPPPTVAQHGNMVQPTVGSAAQRARALAGFASGVRAGALEDGQAVLDVRAALGDAHGAPNPAYCADGVHADPRALPIVLEAIQRAWNIVLSDATWISARALAQVAVPAEVESMHVPGGLQDPQRARELLIEHAALRCAAIKARRVAIYGAGQHTRAMGLDVLTRAGLRVVMIVDDNAVPGTTVLGVPVVRPARGLRADAVIVSSDAHEAALAERARTVFGKRVPVVRIYEWQAATG